MEYLLDLITTFLVKAFVSSPVETSLFIIVFGILGYLIFGSKVVSTCKLVAKDHFCVKEQMKVTDLYIDKIKEKLEDLFLKMKKELNGTTKGLMEDPEVKNFKLLAGKLSGKIKKALHHDFTLNHLIDKPNYDLWIEQRSEEILREFKEQYNIWYTPNAPTNENYYDRYFAEKKAEIKDYIKTVLRVGREIAIQFQERKYVKKYYKQTSQRVRG